MRTDDVGLCAYHCTDASMEDMIYDVGRIVFDEYPSVVQDYVAAITDAYYTTWQLPPLINSVGLTADTILKVRSFRACCVIEMFDFLSHSPVAADHGIATANQRKSSDASRLVVHLQCYILVSSGIAEYG